MKLAVTAKNAIDAKTKVMSPIDQNLSGRMRA
jgi:hypothetical protein